MRKLILLLSAVLFCFTLSYAESCSSGQGTLSYQISSCGDQSRACCSGQWCSWSTSGCSYTQSCTATSESRNCSGNVANATAGTQTRTRSVTGTCGSCSYNSWGSWTGTCTCASGWTWNSSGNNCVYCAFEVISQSAYNSGTKLTSHSQLAYACNLSTQGKVVGLYKYGSNRYSSGDYYGKCSCKTTTPNFISNSATGNTGFLVVYITHNYSTLADCDSAQTWFDNLLASSSQQYVNDRCGLSWGDSGWYTKTSFDTVEVVNKVFGTL